MHLKQIYPHLQVVLSIGGGASAETFPIVASNTLLRDNFARSARGLVEASGLDGIDSGFFLLYSSQPRTTWIIVRWSTAIQLQNKKQYADRRQLFGNTPALHSREMTSSPCWQQSGSISPMTTTYLPLPSQRPSPFSSVSIFDGRLNTSTSSTS